MAKSFISSMKLDARPDRLDLRDLPYRPPVRSLPEVYPSDEKVQELLTQYVADDLILDQGQEGACTGFGLACVINYLLWRRHLESGADRPFDSISPRMIYHLARFYDEWPGEDYDGSSCRGAMKAWHKHGVCADKLWPYRDKRGAVRFIQPAQGWDLDAARRPIGVYYRIDRRSVVDMQAAIYQIGAIYCSADVHDGWDLPENKAKTVNHETLPVIGKPKSGETGGHAFAIVGYDHRGFVVQNSWGTTWGVRGFAVLPYEDWVENGTDAWVCALGVPAVNGVSPRHFVQGSGTRAANEPAGIAGAPLIGVKEERHTSYAYRDTAVVPWTTERAYQHSVVMGNNSRVISRLVTAKDAAASVRFVAQEAPARWFEHGRGTPRLVVYAHGGLNSENDSVSRIRVLAPYFEANGIYPIFLTWKTGPLETLHDLVEDEVKDLPTPPGANWLKTLKDAATEAIDRTIEAVCEAASVKSVWSQMKQNGMDSSRSDGGMGLLVKALAALTRQVPELELHFIGHSAGSIILGQTLDGMRGRLTLASCTLYAPACTMDFANDHFVKAQGNSVLAKGQLHIHLLSDERERDDRVGPYNKSLLYLVSRALEDTHKTPLLGMARAFDPRENPDPEAGHSDSGGWNAVFLQSLQAWQKFWTRSGNKLYPVTEPMVSTGPKSIPAAHGSFDNDVNVIAATIRRIRGSGLIHDVENLDY